MKAPRSTKTEPLIKIIVDPVKGDIATTAILALVKIGKPSVERAVKLLNEDDALVSYAKKAIKKALIHPLYGLTFPHSKKLFRI